MSYTSLPPIIEEAPGSDPRDTILGAWERESGSVPLFDGDPLQVKFLSSSMSTGLMIYDATPDVIVQYTFLDDDQIELRNSDVSAELGVLVDQNTLVLVQNNDKVILTRVK